MKHGDQGKGKTAKAASQASAKSVTVLQGGKGGKTGGSKASGEEAAAAKSAGSKKSSAGKGVQAGAEKSGGRLAVHKAEPAPVAEKGDGGKARRGGGDGFNNPVVANAFRRAVAKYPNAFRKLTD